MNPAPPLRRGWLPPVLVLVPVLALGAMLLALWWREISTDPAPPTAQGPAPAAEPEQLDANPAPTVGVRSGEERSWWHDHLTGRDRPSLQPERADDPRAAVLTGRIVVRDEPWRPLARIEVRVVRCWLDTVLPTDAAEQDEPTPVLDGPSTTTDDAGRFTLAVVPPDSELFFLLAPGTVWHDVQRVPTVPLPGERIDLGDIGVAARGGIRGRVVDADGVPQAGVAVRAVDEPLLDPDLGLETARSGRRQGLGALQLERTAGFGLLPAWFLQRDRLLPFPRATTDAAGQFVLTGCRPGNHTVFFGGDGRNGVFEDVLVAKDRVTELGTLHLPAIRWHRWRFVDEEQRPWTAARVALLRHDLGFGAPPGITDAEGLLTMPRPRAGEAWFVLFRAAEGGPWQQVAVHDEHDLHARQITVPRPRRLLVTVHDDNGKPRDDAEVRLYATDGLFRPQDRLLPPGWQPRPLGAGRFAGHCPDRGQIVVVASARGSAPAVARVGAATELDLHLLPTFPVTVRVMDYQRTPIAHADVHVQVHDHPEWIHQGSEWSALANDRIRVGRTGPAGELSIPELFATWMSFSADHPEHARGPGPHLVPAPHQTIEVILRRPARLDGVLTLQRRPAPAGWRVLARCEPPPAHATAASGFRSEFHALVGADGRYGLRGLPAGVLAVEAMPPLVPGLAPASNWRQPQPKSSVLLDEGVVRWLPLEAEAPPWAGPTVLGTVRRNGLVLADAVVRVRPVLDRPTRMLLREQPERAEEHLRVSHPERLQADPWLRHDRTDAAGTFAFDQLAANVEHELRVDLAVQGRLQLLHRVKFRAPTGSIRPLQLDVDIPCGQLELSLWRQGRTHANQLVRLQRGDDPETALRFDLLTAADGVLSLDALPAGDWQVLPADGARCQPRRVRVAPGKATAVTIQIMSPGSPPELPATASAR